MNVVRSAVDTTPPVITFTYPSAEGAVLTTGSMALTFSVADPETDVYGVGAGLGKIDGGVTTWWNGTTWQAGFTTTPFSSGNGNFTLTNPPAGNNRPNGTTCCR